MELSPEQRRQIYEEEKARIEAEAQQEANKKARLAAVARTEAEVKARLDADGQTNPSSTADSSSPTPEPNLWNRQASPGMVLAALVALAFFAAGVNSLQGQTTAPVAQPAVVAEASAAPTTDKSLFDKALARRVAKEYMGSTAEFKVMIAAYPKSPLVAKAKGYMAQNLLDHPANLYANALAYTRKEDFSNARNTASILFSDYPKSPFANKAKALIKQNAHAEAAANEKAAHAAAVAQEAAERASAQLEVSKWRWHWGYNYAEAEGTVTNLTNSPLRNVEAVVSFYDKAGNFISSGSALITYNPILPGQTSPWHAMETYNPEMVTARVEFKELMGGTLATYQRK